MIIHAGITAGMRPLDHLCAVLLPGPMVGFARIFRSVAETFGEIGGVSL